MSIYDNIPRIIRECHFKNVSKLEDIDEMNKTDFLAEIKNKVEDLLCNVNGNMNCVEYTNLHKMLAVYNLVMGQELEAIHHFIESHAVILRQSILHRSMKTKIRQSIAPDVMYGLNSTHVQFVPNLIKGDKNIMYRLSELPSEWYMIQVSMHYDLSVPSWNTKYIPACMHAIHIVVLPTGCNNTKPFCITIPAPKTDSKYDICVEIRKLTDSIKSELVDNFGSRDLYWQIRKKQDDNMKTALTELEMTWLREWRILFMADPIEESELVNNIIQMIDKLISDYKFSNQISDRSKWLLKKIALGACFLSREEIAKAVKYVLPNDEKLAGNITLSIYGKSGQLHKLKEIKRKTLVLIIDEYMDYIPFESIEILRNHPVTRFPSLHIAYTLFKEHEDSIHKGCKVIKAKSDMGTCIVNPSNDLVKMGERLRLFINYWIPNWKSLYNEKPTEEFFQTALTESDILMYNGHGSGIDYLSGDQIERLRVQAIVLLFGCSSVKLLNVGGRFPPYGISNQYLIAASPCVFGMLWVVTDFDTDKMTANFLSNWIPSSASHPWCNVDVDSWNSGTLKFTKKNNDEEKTALREPEMLRVVAKSKQMCVHFMTSAAIVARGLPIRLE